MIVLIVLAIALFVASRVQKRKDVQITLTRCDHPDEPLIGKSRTSAALNPPLIAISAHERHPASGPESSQRHADVTKPTDSTSPSQPRTPSSTSHTKADLIFERLKGGSSRKRQRTINRVRKQTGKPWRKISPARREQLYAEAFGRQIEESPLLLGKLSVRQPKPYLLLLPAELKAMILRNLTSFQDLKSLTQTIAAYHVIADRDNLFTEAAMNELESRNVNFLPRDVALPKPRTVEILSILVRVPGLASNCEQVGLLQAFKAYIKSRRMKDIRFRLTFEQCLALQSVLDVEDWYFHLKTKPGPLTKKVNNPRERVAHCIAPVHKENWLLVIEKSKKSFTSVGHLHHIYLSREPGGITSDDVCDAWRR